LSRLLSDLCDQTYASGIHLNNEMLNRSALTSQGAKARRELLQAMAVSGDKPGLAIEGYGPERAMYESVLAANGMHLESDEGWRVGPPVTGSGLEPAWVLIDEFLMTSRNHPEPLSAIYEVLSSPPYGLREGPIPVLVVAALLYRAEEVALYQDGTFEASLSPETIERLLKAPGRFAVSAVLSTQERVAVVNELQAALGCAPARAGERNAGLMAVLRTLVSRIRALPDFSRRTLSIDSVARDVRTAVYQARDMETLFFEQLPTACGVALDSTDHSAAPRETSAVYARTLAGAVEDLEGAYPRLLEHARDRLRWELGSKSAGQQLREDLRTRSRHLLRAGVSGRLQILVNALVDEVLDERSWTEAVAMAVTGKAPASWTDDEKEAFDARLRELAQSFARFELLYYESIHQGQPQGFEACRIVLTESGAEEIGRVVWVDKAVKESVAGEVDHLVERLGAKWGRDATETLLALICKRLLDRPSTLQPRLFDVTEDTTDAKTEGT